MDNLKPKSIDYTKLLTDGGIILAILSFLSYSFGYMFKLGYCLYFGISTEFISVTFKDLLGAASSIIFLVFMFNILFFLINKKNNKLKYISKIKTNNITKYISFVITCFVALFILNLVLIIIFFNQLNLTFFIYLPAYYIAIILTSFFILFQLIKKELTKTRIILLISIFSITYILAIWISLTFSCYNYAIKQTSFSFINKDKGYIILVNNDRGYICTKLDNDSERTFSKFYIMDYTTISDNHYTIEEKYIGNLKYNGMRHYFFHKGILE